jgi:hypothetical protein
LRGALTQAGGFGCQHPGAEICDLEVPTVSAVNDFRACLVHLPLILQSIERAVERAYLNC